jgi:hypothetical protein
MTSSFEGSFSKGAICENQEIISIKSFLGKIGREDGSYSGYAPMVVLVTGNVEL